ncbi:MAG TPA: hypothetical protein VFD67_09460, partial [Gemmatimonadaceae bacterium]|nr:hypothetical protein [Gemmatimonadaceae bacterium]
ALRSSLGIDQHLAGGFVAALEGLYSKALEDLFFVRRDLREPRGVDRHGRVLYGTINAAGVTDSTWAVPQFKTDVVELTNQSKDYSYSVTGQLSKQFSTSLEAALSLTYSAARDVQSQRMIRNPSIDNWRFGRALAGRQDAMNLGISDFEQPYRLIASGTYRFPWQRFATDLSFYYIGSSGFPFTYLAGGDQSKGDLNADGTPTNDPIYIPRSASDTAEIQFRQTSSASVAEQAKAFDQFIDGASCLRRQRGRIMARNSCSTPWTNTTNLSIRQSVPAMGGHQLAVEIQVFNLLNLLNARWGRIAIPSSITVNSAQVNLLTQVAQTTGAAPQPVFTFDPATRRFDARNVDSYYQIQLAARYSF